MHYSDLTGDFQIMKLCDFGVSIPLNTKGEVDTDTGLEYVGTAPWSAPEVVDNDGLTPITAKTDIFSYGLVLWEMMTLQVPHFDESLKDDINTSDTFVASDDETSGSTATGVRFGKFELCQEARLFLIMYTL
jgi:PDZ-binding kinase